MTTDLNRTDIAPKLKRRWSMILISALMAFLLIGGALALLETLEPAPSPASTAPAGELPRITVMPLEQRQMSAASPSPARSFHATRSRSAPPCRTSASATSWWKRAIRSPKARC